MRKSAHYPYAEIISEQSSWWPTSTGTLQASWQKAFIFKPWDSRFLAMTSVKACDLNGGEGNTVKAFYLPAKALHLPVSWSCISSQYFPWTLSYHSVTTSQSEVAITWGHQPWQEQALGGEADETETRQNSSGDDRRRLDPVRYPSSSWI